MNLLLTRNSVTKFQRALIQIIIQIIIQYEPVSLTYLVLPSVQVNKLDLISKFKHHHPSRPNMII